MGLFKKSEGGFMDVIRCDQQDFLVWKWTPDPNKHGKSNKENAIRWGSSLRVKEGEVAVLLYRQQTGTMQDFIVGPYDDILKTDNLPVLTGILGAAYDGNSPFQAEVYYINMAGVIQIPFTIPYFSVFDPRYHDFSCPVSARGKITFSITDYKQFIKLHRLTDFSLEQFSNQVGAGIKKYAKSFIGNAPGKYGFPVVQLERFIAELSDAMKIKLAPEMLEDFGVTLTRVDLYSIDCDKESEEYKKLYRLTGKQKTKQVIFETDMGMVKSAATDIDDLRDSRLRRKFERENLRRRNKLSAKKEYSATSIFDLFKKKETTQPSEGVKLDNETQYFISVNGESKGPFTEKSISEMIQANMIKQSTMIWKKDMSEWKKISDIPEFSSLFMPTPPPVV